VSLTEIATAPMLISFWWGKHRTVRRKNCRAGARRQSVQKTCNDSCQPWQ